MVGSVTNPVSNEVLQTLHLRNYTADWSIISGMGQQVQRLPASVHEGHVEDPAADFVKLGIEPQRISSIIATIRRAEQSLAGSSPLSPSEAKELVEILDRAVSSENASQDSKERFSGILRRVCHSHNVLPTSYWALGVVSFEIHALGGFADIHKGQYAGKPVRIKAFRRQNTTSMELIRRRLYGESVRWKYILHPNVLPFLGISETPSPFCIISPWMPNGNIVEYTKGDRGVNRLLLLAQSACGLEHLHSLDIVHSNINPGNILITEDGVACIADFAISGIITSPIAEEPGSAATSKRELVRYMAPEQMKLDRRNSNASKESDIHSLAMTTYEVLTEIQPFNDTKRPGQIIRLVTNGTRPSRPAQDVVDLCLPDSVWVMMETCWRVDPSSRLCINEVYQTLLRSADNMATPGAGNGEIPRSHPSTPSPEPQGGGNSPQDNQPLPRGMGPQPTPWVKRRRLKRAFEQGLNKIRHLARRIRWW